MNLFNKIIDSLASKIIYLSLIILYNQDTLEYKTGFPSEVQCV